VIGDRVTSTPVTNPPITNEEYESLIWFIGESGPAVARLAGLFDVPAALAAGGFGGMNSPGDCQSPGEFIPPNPTVVWHSCG